MGYIPTVLGPGQGVFQGGPLILVCQNQTGVTLTEGESALFDVPLGTATELEGGEAGTAALNTMVAVGTTIGSDEVSYYGPAAAYQDLSLADGVDGRFLVRGIGQTKNNVATQALPWVGALSGALGNGNLVLPEYVGGGAVAEYGKVVAIGREACVSNVGEAWYDGWNGFGTAPIF